MPVDIGKALGDTLTKLYKDPGVLAIAVIEALIAVFISYYVLSSSLGLILSTTTGSPGHLIGSLASLALSFIVLVIIELLLGVLFCATIVSRAHYGTKQSVADAFRTAASRYFIVLAVEIIIAVVAGVALLVVFAFLTVVPILGLLLLLAYFILLVYAGIMVSLSVPYAVVGRLGPIEALRASWNAVRGNWWYVFITFFVLTIVYFIVIFIFEIPLYAVAFTSAVSGLNMTPYSTLNSTGLNGTYNGTTANAIAANVIRTRLSKVYSGLFSSPVYYAVIFLSEIITTWFVIMTAVLYGQLSAAKAGKPRKAPSK